VQLALFDLDGTITWRDSFVPYLRGFLARHPAHLSRLWRAPVALARFAIDGGDRGRLKESLMVGLFRPVERTVLDVWTRTFVDALLTLGTRAQGLAQIERHRAQGDRLVLLSASPDLYVNRIGERLGFDETISTGVRWNGDQFDGHLTTPNRRGEEKSRCLEDLRRRHAGLRVVAYGNSASDFAHLTQADEGWLVSDSSGLIRHAAQLGLRTCSWH
jgi:HAD superfamily phosphoserine phosphatase-like hydrolase